MLVLLSDVPNNVNDLKQKLLNLNDNLKKLSRRCDAVAYTFQEDNHARDKQAYVMKQEIEALTKEKEELLSLM